MGTMIDAVDPAHIDHTWDGGPSVRITVLGDDTGQVFDRENSDASAVTDARAIRRRLDRGQWSIAYVDEDLCNELSAALAANGVAWSEPELWPEPGCYLWATDPSNNIGSGRWVPPVRPIAVQDVFAGGYDLSRTVDNFTARVAGYIDGPVSAWPPAAWTRFTPIPDRPPGPTPAPKPAPTPTGVCEVQLPQLSQPATGPAVRAGQVLLGGIKVDGIFGPLTKAAVENFQHTHGLAVDGVIGTHTWGALLGAPQ